MKPPVLFGDLVTRSPAMRRIFCLVGNLSASECPLVLVGEPGVGRNALARAIHVRSPRWMRAYVRLNCAALPVRPLDQEAFDRRLAAAREGTFVLANLPTLELHLQRRLLDALQTQACPRTIATLSRPAPEHVARGELDPGLANLLQALVIVVPPLRERPEDIEPIAVHLLIGIGASRRRNLCFSPAAIHALVDHPWPGNVSELQRAVEHAASVCEHDAIEPDDLPDSVATRSIARSDAAATVRAILALEPSQARAELLAALEAHHWRRGDAARALGISRATLWRRMRDAGI